MSAHSTKARLLERGLLSPNQLGVALSEQKRAYRPLGQILVGLGFVRVETIAELVAEDLGVPFLRASQIEPDPLVLASVDRDFVQATGAFPIRLEGEQLLVAMVDPDSPERLSGEWWQAVPFARDYWRCESDELGQDLLLYRDSGGWRLQGWYD